MNELKIFNFIRDNEIENIKKYINSGIDINQITDIIKRTPLEYAINLDRTDVIKLLISRGANLNQISDIKFNNFYKSKLNELGETRFKIWIEML